MCVIDLGLGLNFCLEVSIFLEEVLQVGFGDRNSRPIVGILIWQVHYLQKPCIRKRLNHTRKSDNSKVVSGLEQKIQPQA